LLWGGRPWSEWGARGIGGVIGRPEGGGGDEVFLFLVKAGADFLEGEGAGDVHAFGDVGRGENEAGEFHTFER